MKTHTHSDSFVDVLAGGYHTVIAATTTVETTGPVLNKFWRDPRCPIVQGLGIEISERFRRELRTETRFCNSIVKSLCGCLFPIEK